MANKQIADQNPADSPAAEQAFFADPAIDRLLGVVMNLATEVFVLRERCAAMESRLVTQGALDADELAQEASPIEVHERSTERQAFVDHLLEPLLGTQTTRGVAHDTQ